MEVMKIRLLAILIPLTCIFFACSEKDIETFHGRHQIYFDKFYLISLIKLNEIIVYINFFSK